MPRLAAFALLACFMLCAQQRYAASGLVIAVDPASKTVTISHGSIGSYMDAMTMPFHADSIPPGLKRGDSVSFALVVGRQSSSITDVKVVPFESAERDPATASRLAILDSALAPKHAQPIAAGATIPDFTLTDQTGRRVSLHDFTGKVIAIDFIYTRCPLPDYCFRLSTNMSRLAKRFAASPDLSLLTITFDPVHDTQEVLAKYARVWNADPSMWRFLTGTPADVERVCNMFGVAYWNDDGLFTHTLHTAVIDRTGHLAANMEGNRFTAQQLGDLVNSMLRRQ